MNAGQKRVVVRELDSQPKGSGFDPQIPEEANPNPYLLSNGMYVKCSVSHLE